MCVLFCFVFFLPFRRPTPWAVSLGTCERSRGHAPPETNDQRAPLVKLFQIVSNVKKWEKCLGEMCEKLLFWQKTCQKLNVKNCDFCKKFVKVELWCFCSQSFLKICINFFNCCHGSDMDIWEIPEIRRCNQRLAKVLPFRHPAITYLSLSFFIFIMFYWTEYVRTWFLRLIGSMELSWSVPAGAKRHVLGQLNLTRSCCTFNDLMRKGENRIYVRWVSEGKEWFIAPPLQALPSAYLLKEQALVCTKPFEVSKLSRRPPCSCFRSCWKKHPIHPDKKISWGVVKSALLDLLAKMLSMAWLLPPLIIASCIQHILVGWELGNRYNQAFMNAGNYWTPAIQKTDVCVNLVSVCLRSRNTSKHSDLQERVTANCTNHVSILVFFYSTEKQREEESKNAQKSKEEPREEQKNAKQNKKKTKREHDNLFHFHSPTWVCVYTMNTEPKCCITNLANLVCYSRVNRLLTKLTV